MLSKLLKGVATKTFWSRIDPTRYAMSSNATVQVASSMISISLLINWVLSIFYRWVLTAAHCLPSGEQTSKVWVYIGNIYSHINKRKRSEKIKAKAIFIHPNYAGTGFKGNL